MAEVNEFNIDQVDMTKCESSKHVALSQERILSLKQKCQVRGSVSFPEKNSTRSKRENAM